MEERPPSCDSLPDCCCKSTDYLEFHGSYGKRCCCKVDRSVEYDVTFTGSWSNECHPDYHWPGAGWSEFVVNSHPCSYKSWNGCMNNVTAGQATLSQTGNGVPYLAELNASSSVHNAARSVKKFPSSK